MAEDEFAEEMPVEVHGAPMVLDAPRDLVEHRNRLVARYFNGHGSLRELLRAEGNEDLESLLLALVEEIVKETDNLLGNELIATEEGSLRDASVISYKRSEVLEKAIKAVQTKQMFEREHGLDLDSPSMRTVFKYFMAKVKHTFAMLGYNDEASDTFFRMLSTDMEDWKKELEEELSTTSIEATT